MNIKNFDLKFYISQIKKLDKKSDLFIVAFLVFFFLFVFIFVLGLLGWLRHAPSLHQSVVCPLEHEHGRDKYGHYGPNIGGHEPTKPTNLYFIVAFFIYWKKVSRFHVYEQIIHPKIVWKKNCRNIHPTEMRSE